MKNRHKHLAMEYITKATKSLLLLLLVTLGARKASAQFTGTSYLGACVGTAVPHSTTHFSSPELTLSASYGYLLSEKLTIDVPLIYQGLSNGKLKGQSYTALPTILYSISKGDKHRIDLGGSLGVGFEKYFKPSDPLVEVKGSLETVSFYLGAGLRYTLLLSSKFALFGQYKYLYQPQSTDNMAQTLSAGLLFYL